MKTRKSWREKLEKQEGLPKIVDVPPKWEKRYGKGKMLVPKPLDVDALIRKVRKGRLVTLTQLRERLAKDFRVDHTCPLTTGIFVRIAAEVAEEDLRDGRKRITPYWRVLRTDGSLNDKFPGGVQKQAEYLKAEGHLIHRVGRKKSLQVKDFEKRLQEL